VTTAAEICLGVIAAATLAIAVAQVGVMVVAGRLARRVDQLSNQFEHEIKPIFGHLNAIGRDASRAAALATVQVERADQLFSDFVQRVDQALNSMQSTLGTPAREGRALFRGFRAAFQAIRELRQNGRSRQGRSDDEDALFI
jgi:hypothetical protein